jgi:hypothetical protein
VDGEGSHILDRQDLEPPVSHLDDRTDLDFRDGSSIKIVTAQIEVLICILRTGFPGVLLAHGQVAPS